MEEKSQKVKSRRTMRGQRDWWWDFLRATCLSILSLWEGWPYVYIKNRSNLGAFKKIGSPEKINPNPELYVFVYVWGSATQSWMDRPMSMGKRLHLSKSQLTGTPAALNKTAQHSAGPHAPPYPGLFSPAREKPKLISASRGGSPSLSFQCLISARQPSSSSHTLPLTFSWFPHLRISGFPQLCPFPKHAHRSPTSALQSLSLTLNLLKSYPAC